METSILINVNLPGALGGAVKSVTRQKNLIYVTNPETKETEPCVRKILHTDREIRECVRSFIISGEIVASWVEGNCPMWEKPYRWRTMSKNQKLRSYVYSYDEGFGVTYKSIDDEEN